MATKTDQFVQYCRRVLDFDKQIRYEYQSLSICIIDCIYSLRAQYESSTISVINRYANQYMNGDKNSSGDGVKSLIGHILEAGGPGPFAEAVLKNKQKSGQVLKAEVCLNLARYLGYLHIDSIDDFQSFEAPELLETVIRSVKGIGDAGTNYLFMLAGNQDRCKPDVHVHQFIIEACGEDISNEECQTLFQDAVNELKNDYPSLTVAKLDGIIWRSRQKNR
jgi:hypothetical protein